MGPWCSRCSSTSVRAPELSTTSSGSLPEFPQVGFAAVGVKEDAASVAQTVRSRQLTFPVGVDADGRLGGLYAMVSCPQITFVYPGGVVQGAALLSRPGLAELRARVTALLAASHARGWKPARARGSA